MAGRDYSVVEEHLRDLATRGESRLKAGDSALDVVEFAVAELEACGMYVAGRGPAPNTARYGVLDAASLEGARRAAGDVAGRRAGAAVGRSGW